MESISHVKTRPLKESVPVHKLPGHYCLALYSVDGSYYRGYIDTVTDELAQVIHVHTCKYTCVYMCCTLVHVFVLLFKKIVYIHVIYVYMCSCVFICTC